MKIISYWHEKYTLCPTKSLNNYLFTVLSCPRCWQNGFWRNSAGDPGQARWQLLGDCHGRRRKELFVL